MIKHMCLLLVEWESERVYVEESQLSFIAFVCDFNLHILNKKKKKKKLFAIKQSFFKVVLLFLICF